MTDFGSFKSPSFKAPTFRTPTIRTPKVKVSGVSLGGESRNKRQPIAQSTKRAVEIKQHGKCAICHKFLIGSKHFDHIKPVHKGGKSTTDNLRLICASCHDERHIIEKAQAMDKKKRNANRNNNSWFLV